MITLRDSGNTVGGATAAFTAASLTASGFSTTAAAIRQLVFRPSTNQTAVGTSATTGFAISVTDSESFNATDGTTSVSTLSVNDTPMVAVALVSQNRTQEQAL